MTSMKRPVKHPSANRKMFLAYTTGSAYLNFANAIAMLWLSECEMETLTSDTPAFSAAAAALPWSYNVVSKAVRVLNVVEIVLT